MGVHTRASVDDERQIKALASLASNPQSRGRVVIFVSRAFRSTYLKKERLLQSNDVIYSETSLIKLKKQI